MRPFSLHQALGLILFSCLFSCGGGGGGGGSSAGIDGSGAPAIAVVSGPINGFGSVILNGVHYNTDNAEFWVRGQRASEAALNVGSYIHLEGTVDADGREGVAKRIYFQPNVMGAVSSVNVLAETFVVMGQTVHLADDTMLDFAITPRDISGIKVGQWVEVSGPLNAEGGIIATRVGLMQTSAKELAGAVTDYNPSTKTFRINGVTVDFSKTLAPPSLNNGQRVILREATLANGVVQPGQIELEYKPNLPQGQLITQTGLITRFASLEDFSIGNFDVTTDAITQYQNTEAQSLGLNVRVTVVGHLKDGKLLADKIIWLANAEWKIQGPIEDMRNISATGGEILVQGQWQTLTAFARLDSETSMKGDRMKFSNLDINDFVVLTGHQEGEQRIVDSLEREARPKFDIEKKILGFVQMQPIESAATSFWLAPQILVQMQNDTRYYLNGVEITQAQFLKKAPGQFITLFGVLLDDGSFRQFKASRIKLTLAPMPGTGWPSPYAPPPSPYYGPDPYGEPDGERHSGKTQAMAPRTMQSRQR
ncbi:MAG: hypothetical protein RL497_1797 [Pseudomonadota bacterium]|jgi:hypothetical protein